jgi:ABC-type cobalt transport system substrate-binding protein
VTLQEYDQQVGQHLHAIVAAAEMIKSHVGQLVYKPAFETVAHERMTEVEKLLHAAGRRVGAALKEYRDKEKE